MSLQYCINPSLLTTQILHGTPYLPPPKGYGRAKKMKKKCDRMTAVEQLLNVDMNRL